MTIADEEHSETGARRMTHTPRLRKDCPRTGSIYAGQFGTIPMLKSGDYGTHPPESRRLESKEK